MEVVRMAMGLERSEFIRKAIQYFIEHEYKPKENVTKARVEKGVRL
jgi:metal-responsive CopG/Arc/MetJ family transcriptional regulator